MRIGRFQVVTGERGYIGRLLMQDLMEMNIICQITEYTCRKHRFCVVVFPGWRVPLTVTTKLRVSAHG